MHRKSWVVLLLSVFACAAFAAGPGAVRKQVESSMLVTGTIDVEPDGSVSGHTLDDPGKLPPGVVELIGKAVPNWRFEPVVVDGNAIKARAKMSLRVVAKKLDDQRYSIGIRSASFGQDNPGESVSAKQMRPPTYPGAALVSGVTGTVYVVLRIGRDGRVQDAIAEQVNLKVIASEREMDQWRQVFAGVVLASAKRWTFNPPTAGDEAGAEHWQARVPVAFRLEAKEPKYGKWETYVPGPRQTASWMDRDEAAATGGDAYVAGTVSQIGQGLHLLTPLDKG